MERHNKADSSETTRILTLPTEKIGERAGRLTKAEITTVNRTLSIMIGLDWLEKQYHESWEVRHFSKYPLRHLVE